MGEFEICWRLGAFYPTGCTFIIYIYACMYLYNVYYTMYIIQNFHNSLLYLVVYTSHIVYVMRKQQRISPGSSQWNRCRQFSQLWWGNSYFIITVFWSKLCKNIQLQYVDQTVSAESQINYILGDTGRSYVCGWWKIY